MRYQTYVKLITLCIARLNHIILICMPSNTWLILRQKPTRHSSTVHTLLYAILLMNKILVGLSCSLVWYLTILCAALDVLLSFGDHHTIFISIQMTTIPCLFQVHYEYTWRSWTWIFTSCHFTYQIRSTQLETYKLNTCIIHRLASHTNSPLKPNCLDILGW